MNPSVVRHLLLPLHERLRGRDSFRRYRELMESQWWPPERLHQYQTEKLRALLAHASQCIPFYREILSRADLDVTSDPWSLLNQLPIMSKARIREQFDSLVWPAAPGGLHGAFTGGSSGETLHFCFDRRRQSYDRAARMRTHAWFGVRPGDREIYLWGAQFEIRRQDRLRKWRDELTNERMLTAYDLSPASMTRYWRIMEAYRPHSIYGYPGSLEVFCRYADSQGWSPLACKPKAIFVTGEHCHSAQRERIERFFKCPVANNYGSREAGFIAHECPAGGMHITAENIIIEVIDPDSPGNQAVYPAKGEPGELVITHLDNYAMPFIRYRIGDLGRISLNRCPCGRAAPMLEDLVGRRVDHLRKPEGGVAHGLSVIYILRELKTIQRFQVHQDASDLITIRVIPEPAFASADLEYIHRRFRGLMGEAVRLNIETVPSIAPLDSGKFRYIVSDPPGSATQSEPVRGAALSAI